MKTLRLICTQADSGAACHVGGPVAVAYKTFDIPCPPELAEWLRGRATYFERFISGIEVVEPTPPTGEGEGR